MLFNEAVAELVCAWAESACGFDHNVGSVFAQLKGFPLLHAIGLERLASYRAF